MNCYDFELNISAYIDGELKQAVRENFINHKETCGRCFEKLSDISNIMGNMLNITNVKTSSQFDQVLRERIIEIDNKGPSFWQRFLLFKPFGLNRFQHWALPWLW